MGPDLCSILKLNSCSRFRVKGSQKLKDCESLEQAECVRVGPAPPSFFLNSILELGNAPECMEPIRHLVSGTGQYSTRAKAKAAEKELRQ